MPITVRFWYWDVAGLVPCPLGGGLEHRPGHAAGRGLGLEGVLGAVGEAGGDGAHGGRGVGERPGDAAKRAADLPVVELDVDGHQKEVGRATARGKGHEAGLQVRGAQRQDPEGEYLSKLAHELMDIQYEADELLEPERVAWVTESMRGIEQRERAGD